MLLLHLDFNRRLLSRFQLNIPQIQPSVYKVIQKHDECSIQTTSIIEETATIEESIILTLIRISPQYPGAYLGKSSCF